MNGLKISELLKKICEDIASLPEVFDCKLFGGEINDHTIMKKISIKTNKKVQCFLEFGGTGTNDDRVKSKDTMFLDVYFSLIIFGIIDKESDVLGFSTAGSDASQKIAGFINNQKFGFISDVMSNPVILNLSPIGDAFEADSQYQIWQIAWTQKVRISTI